MRGNKICSVPVALNCESHYCTEQLTLSFINIVFCGVDVTPLIFVNDPFDRYAEQDETKRARERAGGRGYNKQIFVFPLSK